MKQIFVIVAAVRAFAAASSVGGMTAEDGGGVPASTASNEYVGVRICVQDSPPFTLHAAKEGADGKLIRILRSRLFPKVQVLRLGPQDAQDVVAELRRLQCDVVFLGVQADEEQLHQVGPLEMMPTDNFHVDRIQLCSAKLRSTDDWKKLRTITTTQLAMVVPFTLYVGVTYLVGRKLLQPERFQRLEIIFWAYFRVISSVPNSTLRQPRARSLRLLYTAWLLFCFILTINYNTLILRVFKKERFTPQIHGVHEALTQRYPLYTLAAFRAAMNYPLVRDCSSPAECLRMLEPPPPTEPDEMQTNAPKLLVGLPAAIIDYHRKRFMEFGESTIHCFEHPSAVYKRRMLVARGRWAHAAASIGALNQILKSINRSGIYNYWLTDVVKSNLQVQRSFHQYTNPAGAAPGVPLPVSPPPPPTTMSEKRAENNATGIGGMLKALWRRVFAGETVKHLNENAHPIGVLVEKDFIVLYAYLFIGVVCSTIGFIAEHVYYYCKHRKCYWVR